METASDPPCVGYTYGDFTPETFDKLFSSADFVSVKKEPSAIVADDESCEDGVKDEQDAPGSFQAPPVVEEIPEIQVSNIVCKTHVGCPLNLDHCCANLRNSQRTNKFPALFVRMRKPSVTLLLYRTGTVVATGACSYADNARAARRIVRSLMRLGYPAVLHDLVVENILANFSLGFKVQISKISEDPRYSAYCEPQQSHFACVNFKVRGPLRSL